MKISIKCLLILASFASCSPEKKDNPNISSFEISYSANYDEKFSFFVDSNKIYFIENGSKLYYGSLPDSLMNFINKDAFLLSSDTARKHEIDSCLECPEVAIKLVYDHSIVQFHEKGLLDSTVMKLVDRLINFISLGKYKILDSQDFWGTKKAIMPMPPKIMPVEFKSKSGR